MMSGDLRWRASDSDLRDIVRVWNLKGELPFQSGPAFGQDLLLEAKPGLKRNRFPGLFLALHEFFI